MPTHRPTLFFMVYERFQHFFPLNFIMCKKPFQSEQKKVEKKATEKTHQYQNISKPTKPAKYGVLLYSLNMLQLAHTSG